MVKEQMIKNKVKQEELDEFNLKIRQDDGKLSLFDLKKLNSVYKKEYVSMVMHDDTALKEYLAQTHEKLDEEKNAIVDLEWGIEDTKDVWDQA